MQAGLTKGYAQDHTDYSVPNGRPKKLWLKELAPHAGALLCARELPAAYARALTAFRQAHAGLLPRSLALDGKSVGHAKCGMIITLCRHEDGRPVALTVARGQKEDGEVSAGRTRLADPHVARVNALVTADPLHNQDATARVILDQGGDSLLGTKANTAQRLAGATQALQGTPF